MLTAATVKAAPLDQYRILHFATHGLLPEETAVFLPEVNEPALVLTPPTSPRSGDTGLLTASEITELRLNADLVVLSACNTAGGDRPGSEALSGLARAFFYAGARTLLVSHWDVSSVATTWLIAQMFDTFATDKNIKPAEALQRSMMNMIDRGGETKLASPQFWAAFIVVGDVSSTFAVR